METLPSPEHRPEYLTEKQVLESLTHIIETIKQPDQTEIISIVGGAGSGKTTFANLLKTELGSADILGTDNYVIGDRNYRRTHLEGGDPTRKYNPARLNEHITSIKALATDESLPVPTYDEATGYGVDTPAYSKSINKVDFLLVEGDFDFVENPDLLIYFDVPDSVRLKNRIERDLVTRGAVDPAEVEESFHLRQKLQHLPYTAPTKEKADFIITVHTITQDDKTTYEYQIVEGTAINE